MEKIAIKILALMNKANDRQRDMKAHQGNKYSFGTLDVVFGCVCVLKK